MIIYFSQSLNQKHKDFKFKQFMNNQYYFQNSFEKQLSYITTGLIQKRNYDFLLEEAMINFIYNYIMQKEDIQTQQF
ncbi:unnamed protein product [Paramecium sonneborni]|uniref:Uncharacterized protein n=1 Tax=Paramecium sonneborni TaxID=65129 RepID=A0A8S1RQW0_9CILI|nr:unnamed protein product [Paramecium sonneborni]